MNKLNLLLSIWYLPLFFLGALLQSCNDPIITVVLSYDDSNEVILGDTVSVRVAVSSFENEDESRREWIFTTPEGSSSTLSGRDSDSERSFVPDVPGRYTVQLTVEARWGRNNTIISDFDRLEINVFPPNEDYSSLRILRLPPDTIVREPIFNLPYVAYSTAEENYEVGLALNGVSYSSNSHLSEFETVVDSFILECLDPGLYIATMNLTATSGEVLSSLNFQFEVVPDVCSLSPSTDCQSGNCGDAITDAFIPQEGCVSDVELNPAGNVLANSGFEDGDISIGPIPPEPGFWQGDKARVVEYNSAIGTYHGIHVLEGNFMMAFLGSATGAASTTTVSGQMFQSYLLTLNQINIANNPARELRAIFRAYVNRVEGDAETDTRFYVTLGAYDGGTDTYRDKYRNNEEINGAEAVASIFSDACVDTWELLTDTLIIPPGTRYLGLQIAAFEDVLNETGFETEFDGHFIDGVSLVIQE